MASGSVVLDKEGKLRRVKCKGMIYREEPSIDFR
jgi:hypothetical protein